MLNLTPDRWGQLRSVNSRVNRLRYVRDQDRYGLPDFWTQIDAAGGDCEDYALKKRRLLLDAGWALDALCLACCWTETGEYHAVLLIEADQGTYVLDNRFADVAAWADLTNRGYRWDRRQAPGQAAWVAIAA